MRRFTMVAVALAMLAAIIPAAAAKDSRDRGRAFSIGFQLQAGPVAPEQLAPSCIPVPTPPAGGTSAGTWTAAGSLADAGQAAACFRLSPGGTRLALEGALRLVSEQGTITLEFEGFGIPSGTEPPLALLQRGRATAWRVSDSTGAYRGLRIRDKGGEVVANLARGEITVILDGVRISH